MSNADKEGVCEKPETSTVFSEGSTLHQSEPDSHSTNTQPTIAGTGTQSDTTTGLDDINIEFLKFETNGFETNSELAGVESNVANLKANSELFGLETNSELSCVGPTSEVSGTENSVEASSELSVVEANSEIFGVEANGVEANSELSSVETNSEISGVEKNSEISDVEANSEVSGVAKFYKSGQTTEQHISDTSECVVEALEQYNNNKQTSRDCVKQCESDTDVSEPGANVNNTGSDFRQVDTTTKMPSEEYANLDDANIHADVDRSSMPDQCADGGDAPDGLLSNIFSCAGAKSKLKDEDRQPYTKHGTYKHIPQDKRTAPTVGRSTSYEEAVSRQNHGVINKKQTTYKVGSNVPEALRVTESIDMYSTTAPRSASSTYSTNNSRGTMGHVSNVTPHKARVPQHRESRVQAQWSLDEDVYDFSHAQRGYMVIIVNDRFLRQSSRDGAESDLRNMKEIARKFGFRLFNYGTERNLTKAETIQLITKARRMDYSDCDCFTFMISTHGLEQANVRADGRVDHALVCADDQLIFTSYITDMFSDENCPTLKNKPKFFFIQACRGENLDHGSDVYVLGSKNNKGVDKTCSVAMDKLFHMGSSSDESDTRGATDSWMKRTQSNATAQLSQPTRGMPPSGTVPISEPTTHTFRNDTSPGTGHYLAHNASMLSRPNIEPTSPRWRPSIVPNMSMKPTPPSVMTASGSAIKKMYAPTPYPVVESPSLKCDNDMLVMYAIPPGMFAWRNTADGSWMIHYLHRVLMAYDMKHPKNLLSVLTKVTAQMALRTTNAPSSRELHQKKAVSVVEHKLTRDVYFHQKVPVSNWMRSTGATQFHVAL